MKLDYCEIWFADKLVLTLDLCATEPVSIFTEDIHIWPMPVRHVMKKQFATEMMKQVHLVSAVTMFVLDRTFPETRQNSRNVLEALELSRFDKIAIVGKTYGLMYHDYWWVKLDREDLTIYEDIKIRPGNFSYLEMEKLYEIEDTQKEQNKNN